MSHRPTSRSRRRAAVTTALATLVPLALAAGCSSQASSGETTEDGKVAIPLWTHSAGSETEMAVLNQIIDDFNASQDTYEVEEQEFPQEAYNDSVQGAAAADDLPCVLDVDGPIMPNWAWNGWMVPTGLTDADVAAFLPSTVGRYNDEIYSVGYWDATTVMFTRKSILDKHGIRVPTVDEPWTADEYAGLQQKIADSGDFKNVVDYGPSWTGEWWSYAFGTFLTSFGGDEIDRDGFTSTEGVLNGPEALEFATWFQDQFADGYAAKSNSPDRTEFLEGKVAIQFNGNWEYAKNVEKYGDDLVIAPTPDFGNGSVSGAGSWQYGLTKSCSEAQLAGGLEYLKFSLDDKYIAMYSDATSLIPATSTAGEQTTKGYYGPGEPLEVVSAIAQKYAQVRPETPAYPVISQVFEKQLQDIMNGKDPQEGLDQMVSEIDADLASAGYDN